MPRFLAAMAMLTASSSALDPEYAELLTRVKDEFETLGKASDVSINELREAVADEEDVDLLTAYGYALIQGTDPRRVDNRKEAVIHMAKALKLGKKLRKGAAPPVSLHATLVQTLLQLGKTAEASATYELHKLPLSTELHQILALRLAQGVQSDRASASALLHSSKAMELASEEPTSQLARGFSLLLGKEVSEASREQAIHALRTCFTLRAADNATTDSAFPEAWPAELEATGHHALGKLLASFPDEPEENAQLDEALGHFEQAIKLVPQHAPYAESLSHVQIAVATRRRYLTSGTKSSSSSLPKGAMPAKGVDTDGNEIGAEGEAENDEDEDGSDDKD